MGGGVILFAAPSLTLVGQARRAWFEDRDTDLQMHSVVVCSRGEVNRNSWRHNNALTIDAPATTDPQKISNQVSRAKQLGGRVVIFSTYQSIDRICEAQRDFNLGEIDLCIADEAHRTTGALFDDEDNEEQLTRCFQLIHKGLAARKRLYQTATPRIFHERTKLIVQSKAEQSVQRSVEIVDMDDDVYGDVLDQLDFVQALEEMPDRMCDYKIMILLSNRGHGSESIERAVAADSEKVGGLSTSLGARLAGLNLAIHGAVEELWNADGELHVSPASVDIKSLIGFCNTRAKARWAAEALQAEGVAEWAQERAEQLCLTAERRQVRAKFIDGNASPTERREALDTLRQHQSDSARAVVMNAKLLTEGVDVPALDAICFLEERRSEVDIVQAVGRVMRRFPGKERGYIIVPVELGEQPSLQFEKELAERVKEGRILGQVLRALRAHDPRVQTQLHERIIIAGSTNGSNRKKPKDVREVDSRSWKEYLLDEGKFEHVCMGLSRETGLGTPARDVANLIEGAVLRASQKLEEEGLRSALADVLAMDHESGSSPCTVGAVLLMNALLVHQRIIETSGSVLSRNRSIENLRSSISLDSKLVKTWSDILEYDYEPVFRTPLKLLERIRSEYGDFPQGARKALRLLSDKAVEVANRYVEMGMDHAGQLYQRVMGNVASDGACFTLPNAARVLSGLAIHASKRECSDLPLWRKGTIVDPACGSGTLLLGMLTAIKENDSLEDNIHRVLVENHLGGMDINPQSVQLAACQLTVGDPSVSYRRMNLWTMPLGPYEKETRTGSMDSLAEIALEEISDLAGASETSAQRILGWRSEDCMDGEVRDFLRKAKIFVMNPPYTINEKAMTKLDKRSRAEFRIQMNLIRGLARKAWPNEARVVNKKTLNPLFTLLAGKCLSQHAEGVLAKVMPYTACTSGSGLNERRYLASEFHVEYIVTLHSSKTMNWSSGTGTNKGTTINESILVARRSSRDDNLPTKFINLVKRPETLQECDQLVDDIERGDVSAWGQDTTWSNERMRDGRWSAAAWYDSEIAHLYEKISRLEGEPWSKYLMLPLDLGYKVFQTGPTLGGSGWMWTNEQKSGVVPVLKSSGMDATKTLNTKPDAWSEPCGATDKAVRLMNQRRSHLLVPKTQDSRTGRFTAVVAHRSMVGDKWLVIHGPNLHEAKAQAIWINSTLGRITYMSEAARKLTWPLYGKDAVERMPMIDTRNETTTRILVDCYERTCTRIVPVYREGINAVRELWDDAVSRALDLDREEIRRFSQKLVHEPKVAGLDRAMKRLR